MIKNSESIWGFVVAFSVSVLAAAFFSALAATHAVPAMFDVTFGIAPFFVLAAVLVLLALQRLGLDRIQARIAALRIISIAAIVAAFAALTGSWGNIGAILLPQQAWFSILTLGIWPLGEGPIAAVRFIPLIIAIGVFVVARRAGKDERHAALAAVLVYVVQAFVTHAASWMVWVAFMRGPGDIMQNVEDTYRIFITANVNGYWTNAQVARFWAVNGGQAETAIQAVQGVSAGVVALLVAAIAWVPWKQAALSLRKQFDLSFVRQMMLVLIGCVLGVSVRMGTSLSDDLAWMLFIALLISIILAWTSEDRQDENGPWYLFAAYGAACLLGWPVVIGLAGADLLRRQMLKGEAWTGIWSSFVYAALSAFALAWMGLAFGLRDLPVDAWMLRYIAAAALAAGGAWLGSKLLRSALANSWQLLFIAGMAILSALISGQISLFIWAALIAGVAWGLMSREALWETWKGRLLDVYLAGFLLLALCLPRLLAG